MVETFSLSTALFSVCVFRGRVWINMERQTHTQSSDDFLFVVEMLDAVKQTLSAKQLGNSPAAPSAQP
ncbi:MAG: hypothetical protein K2Q14_03490 [Gammaproteobacteria bacterium]|nr:hypothetical protein [Gammaproteobacteria bacterium]